MTVQPPQQPPAVAAPVTSAVAQPTAAPGATITNPQPLAAPVPAGQPAVGAPVAATQVEEWPTGDLPEQTGGGGRSALAPGTFAFRLPASLTSQQDWSGGTYKDFRKVLATGQPNPTFGQQVPFRMLKFGKDKPLVVEGGTSTGEPMTAVFNTIRMPRGPWSKREEPTTPWIHDLAYILETCLGDTSRPQTVDALEAAINRHAGGLIRLTIGRHGECRPDQVRYIPTQRVDKATGQAVPMSQGFDTVPDPSGKKGCGKKYYTRDYAGAEGYQASIQCDPAKGGCGAMIRGFENVEGFLPPLAT